MHSLSFRGGSGRTTADPVERRQPRGAARNTDGTAVCLISISNLCLFSFLCLSVSAGTLCSGIITPGQTLYIPAWPTWFPPSPSCFNKLFVLLYLWGWYSLKGSSLCSQIMRAPLTRPPSEKQKRNKSLHVWKAFYIALLQVDPCAIRSPRLQPANRIETDGEESEKGRQTDLISPPTPSFALVFPFPLMRGLGLCTHF